MFQKLLVPLDGSAREERAVPIAARIAQATGGTVVVLHVVHLLVEYAPSLVQAPALTETALNEALENANAYLARVARSPALEGIKTETEAFFGVEAYTILTFAQASKVDLIVLCSHGRTGFKRWALGSVAQKIARHSTVPVLLLREGAPESRLRDGLAAELGLQVTYSLVSGEGIADALIRTAELGEDTATFQACDLLAMATHGRSGFERWMLGSITERVLDGTHLPLLIVRPAQQQGPTPGELKEAKVNGYI
jgi:nucleotide-binding universal stress UspA family protein